MDDQHRAGSEPASELSIDCGEALAELYMFLDGELTEELRDRLTEHLDECNPCLEVYDFEAELRAVIAQRCKDVVPDSLRERIAAQIEELSREVQKADQ